MLTLIKMLPVWAWAVGAALASLLVFSTVQTVRLAHAHEEFADYKADLDKAARLMSEQNRAIEQKRQQDQAESIENAHQETQAAVVRLAESNAVSDSLQQQVNKLLARRATCNSTATSGSAPAKDLASVLADLRTSADEEAAGMAQAATASRIAGEACERAYDSLRKANTK